MVRNIGNVASQRILDHARQYFSRFLDHARESGRFVVSMLLFQSRIDKLGIANPLHSIVNTIIIAAIAATVGRSSIVASSTANSHSVRSTHTATPATTTTGRGLRLCLAVDGVQALLGRNAHFLIGFVAADWIGVASKVHAFFNGRDAHVILRDAAPKGVARHFVAQFGNDLAALVFDVGIRFGRQSASEIDGHVLAGGGIARRGLGQVNVNVAGSRRFRPFRGARQQTAVTHTDIM